MTETSFDDDECAALQALAGEIIPASETYNVPGADDEVIFAMVMETLAPHVDMIKPLVRALDGLAKEVGGSSFAALAGEARTKVVGGFFNTQPETAALLHILICQCYYRDDRVMISLGMEPRPPFPKGFEVEQGDWGLLDPVKDRKPFWREA